MFYSPHIDEERIRALSSVEWCISLMDAGETHWDVLHAICTHLAYSSYEDAAVRVDWESRAYSPIMDAVHETALAGAPAPRGEVYGREVLTPELSRFFHARVAAGMLLEASQPQVALQYLEQADEVLTRESNILLSTDIAFSGSSRVMRTLRRLYEGFEDYEQALAVHMREGALGAQSEFFERCAAYLTGWGLQLQNNASTGAAVSILDCILQLVDGTEGVDEESRDSPSDSPRNTRQFWSWFYGMMSGRLSLAHPYLKKALVQEVVASDWRDGWPVASLMTEEREDWTEYLATCKRFYSAADVEYKGARPWDATQPPHLSPQSDLYWAMRIGFCEAQVESLGTTQVLSAAALRQALDDIQETLSAIGVRSLRVSEEMKDSLRTLQDAVPTERAASLSITATMGQETFRQLPVETIQHLVVAWLARRQGRLDDARVGTVKAIESVFNRVVVERLQARAPQVKVAIRPPGRASEMRSIQRIGQVSLRDWSTVLGGISLTEGPNSEFAHALADCFPGADLGSLKSCAPGLRAVMNARGQAAHDPNSETYEERLSEADFLWSAAVGTIVEPGLIPRLCAALDIIHPERD